ncbi:adenylate/guanylate cyclase domain-containing protein [Mycobacterium sp. NPDC048908]|uniref:adenylate/guanylate cyclase domain-containing protein n=1 Tax=Mycobacterium sp. NPDC048908 TaxID=3364292 RepID=UPI003712EA4E
MDDSADGRGGLTVAGLSCNSCGTQLGGTAKFCSECGTPVTSATRLAEYKQVTVLFADVVHSMDIAAAVGAERLREIMAELVNCASSVVQSYGGTVVQFTGDGLMAVFGAPIALEDHAVRACLAALGVQEEAKRLALEVKERDGVELQLRIGLNSGQVIAGEIGSGPSGYTTVGEQVGMAQRMESIAPPGGVTLSASTARLVEGAASLAEPELVQIKGADKPVPAQRLLGMAQRDRLIERVESNLVGRRWELSAVEGLLDRAVDDHGAVVGVVGPPGIGKSRLVREVSAIASARGVDVFTTFCESHTTLVPFHAVARLLRAAFAVEGLDGQTARDLVRDRVPDADPEDLLLLDDLLGIADPNAALPAIGPDGRRRRLTALVDADWLARKAPALYVIEDAHWIDEVSESMIADFLTVIPQTASLVLVTYRPEYQGGLSRVADAKPIALAPLSDPETTALVSQLLGPDPSVGALASVIAERAAGNPFFAEEMVRDLAERAVLRGNRSAYVSMVDAAEVTVPATVQASLAARIDRLNPKAKRTLNAAAVIGAKFSRDLLDALGIDPVLEELVGGELIDQIRFTRHPEYVFHHPLIRMVAYESQLKSDRAELHRRLAAAIEARAPASVEKNAALIAEHLEAAGDRHAAYGWHMRAATWANYRDVRAARTRWHRARSVADALPDDDPDRLSMRIAPRAMLCSTAWRVGGDLADSGFDELRELCIEASDKPSLAIAIAGQLLVLATHARHRESSRLAVEFAQLLESIDDPTIIIRALPQVMVAKYEAGAMAEALQLSQRVIDLVDSDPSEGSLVYRTALARATMMRGLTRCCLGRPGWKDDLDQAIAMARGLDLTSRFLMITYIYGTTVGNGALRADAEIIQRTAEALEIAVRSGDYIGLITARWVHGLMLVRRDAADREAGLELLATAREAALQYRQSTGAWPMIDIEIAGEKLRIGDIDDAVEKSRTVFNYLLDTGGMLFRGPAITVLVEALLARGGKADVQEAHDTIGQLEAARTEPGFLFHELPMLRLRALVAWADGDRGRYREYRDRYRDMARTLGFEGHMKWAEAMP